MSFTNDRVKGLCATLHSDTPEGAGYPTHEPRFRFINALVSMVLRLYYRPEWVALERRQPKSWVVSDDRGWRSVDDEKPPTDRPFIAMVKKPRE